ncbi:MAG TPA: sulfur carrier protein ThiS, partial [Luteimonas sp.]|nr:sulfur carrier protein ThiS [Luteimonas sp.]
MRIVLNGKDTQLPDILDVAGLLARLGLEEKRVAVEVNKEIVPKSQHVGRLLCDG